MKSIMYHYIRDKNKLFPYYNILKKDYVNQIKNFLKDWFRSFCRRIIY